MKKMKHTLKTRLIASACAVVAVAGLFTACEEEKTVAVTGVTLDKPTLTLTEGASATLTATVKPDDAANKAISWTTSSSAIATVADGTVTAVAAGAATITVTTADGNKTAQCVVTVDAAVVNVESVSLNKPTLELVEGDKETLEATVLPEEATNRNVTWNSSNDDIATVSTTGEVEAIAEGAATITVTTADGNKTAECVVTVVAAPIHVESVSLNKPTLELVEGDKETLEATVLPEEATNKNVTWNSSDDDIATVSATGEVEAIAEGAATITVTTTDGEKTAECKVTVSEKIIHVTSVELNKATLTLEVDATEQLIATVLPAEATDKSVEWTIDAPDRADVDQNGNITAKSPGLTYVNVTTVDGDFKARCLLTVKAKTVAVASVELNKSTLELAAGASETLEATILPAEATNKSMSWSSNNTDVATVDQTGKVTGITEGAATITVTTSDGGKTVESEVTVTPAASGGYCGGITVDAADALADADWTSANNACAAKGDGWRLPTAEEAQCMCENREGHNFGVGSDGMYWTSTQGSSTDAYVIYAFQDNNMCASMSMPGEQPYGKARCVK